MAEFERVKNHKKKIESEYPIKILSEKGFHVFFGYYDIPPFNDKNEVIYLKTKGDKTAKICKYDNAKQIEEIIATTNIWNWQQGSRLRWFPNSNTEVMFNYSDGEKYISRIVNIITKTERIIDWPIYDISNDGANALSINFSLLGEKRPAYGYTLFNYSNNNKLGEDGIFLVDVKANKSKLLLSFKRILDSLNLTKNDVNKFYLNHISFSPDSKKFLFFLCEKLDNGWHKASLLVYDFKNDTISVIENERKVSHYTWLGNDHIICTSVNNDIKNLDPQYIEYSLQDKSKTIINSEILNKDGHPSMFSEETILSDTYPLGNSYQTLFFYNLRTKEHIKLAEIFHINLTKDDGIEKRTDLHPRLNRDKDLICFDMNTNGVRSLGILNLRK